MSKELSTLETPQQLYDLLLRINTSLQVSVGLRVMLSVGLAAAAQILSGPLAVASVCLCLVATIATAWSIVELVACQWVAQLMVFRELIFPRDAVLTLAEAAILAEEEETSEGESPNHPLELAIAPQTRH